MLSGEGFLIHFDILARESAPRCPPSRLGQGSALSFTNSFHSGTPCALRMSAETGSSFGARGMVSSFRPASCGRRLPLRAFTDLLDHTRFSHASLPPRERGTT